MKKRAIRLTVQLAVVVAGLVIVSRQLDWRDVAALAADANPRMLLCALAAILCEPFCVAAKWRVLLVRNQVHVDYLTVLRTIFTSNFLAILMPTGAGADALRVCLLKRREFQLSTITGTLLADRFVALTCLALLSLTGIPFAWPHVAKPGGLISAGVTAGIVLAGTAFIVSPAGIALVRWSERKAGLIPGGGWFTKLAGFIARTHEVLASVARKPDLLAQIFALNLVVQLLRVAQICFLFIALGSMPPLLYALASIPIIVLLTLLPITPYGFAVKENAFIYFFAAVGMADSMSVAVSVLTYPLILVALLPGVAFFLTGTRIRLDELKTEETTAK